MPNDPYMQMMMQNMMQMYLANPEMKQLMTSQMMSMMKNNDTLSQPPMSKPLSRQTFDSVQPGGRGDGKADTASPIKPIDVNPRDSHPLYDDPKKFGMAKKIDDLFVEEAEDLDNFYNRYGKSPRGKQQHDDENDMVSRPSRNVREEYVPKARHQSNDYNYMSLKGNDPRNAYEEELGETGKSSILLPGKSEMVPVRKSNDSFREQRMLLEHVSPLGSPGDTGVYKKADFRNHPGGHQEQSYHFRDEVGYNEYDRERDEQRGYNERERREQSNQGGRGGARRHNQYLEEGRQDGWGHNDRNSRASNQFYEDEERLNGLRSGHDGVVDEDNERRGNQRNNRDNGNGRNEGNNRRGGYQDEYNEFEGGQGEQRDGQRGGVNRRDQGNSRGRGEQEEGRPVRGQRNHNVQLDVGENRSGQNGNGDKPVYNDDDRPLKGMASQKPGFDDDRPIKGAKGPVEFPPGKDLS